MSMFRLPKVVNKSRHVLACTSWSLPYHLIDAAGSAKRAFSLLSKQPTTTAAAAAALVAAATSTATLHDSPQQRQLWTPTTLAISRSFMERSNGSEESSMLDIEPENFRVDISVLDQSSYDRVFQLSQTAGVTDIAIDYDQYYHGSHDNSQRKRRFGLRAIGASAGIAAIAGYLLQSAEAQPLRDDSDEDEEVNAAIDNITEAAGNAADAVVEAFENATGVHVGDDDADGSINSSSIMELAGPFLRQAGMSGILGFCAGYAAQSVGRKVAIGVGLLVIAVQGLAATGCVSVNWEDIEMFLKDKADLNGDGELDEQDVRVAWERIRETLSFGMSSAAGFGTGFLIGLSN
jgi:uncharacterized membrane protein (Fun14 family)